MTAQRKARLALVTDSEPRKRATPNIKRRRVTLICQECGGQNTYVYPGTGPYRAFCKACR